MGKSGADAERGNSPSKECVTNIRWLSISWTVSWTIVLLGRRLQVPVMERDHLHNSTNTLFIWYIFDQFMSRYAQGFGELLECLDANFSVGVTPDPLHCAITHIGKSGQFQHADAFVLSDLFHP